MGREAGGPPEELKYCVGSVRSEYFAVRVFVLNPLYSTLQTYYIFYCLCTRGWRIYRYSWRTVSLPRGPPGQWLDCNLCIFILDVINIRVALYICREPYWRRKYSVMYRSVYDCGGMELYFTSINDVGAGLVMYAWRSTNRRFKLKRKTVRLGQFLSSIVPRRRPFDMSPRRRFPNECSCIPDSQVNEPFSGQVGSWTRHVFIVLQRSPIYPSLHAGSGCIQKFLVWPFIPVTERAGFRSFEAIGFRLSVSAINVTFLDLLKVFFYLVLVFWNSESDAYRAKCWSISNEASVWVFEFVLVDGFDSTNYGQASETVVRTGRRSLRSDVRGLRHCRKSVASRQCVFLLVVNSAAVSDRRSRLRLFILSATTDNTVCVSFEFRRSPLSVGQTYDLASFSSKIKTY